MFLSAVLAPVLYTLYFFVWAPVWALGWILVPLCAFAGKYHSRPSHYFQKAITAWDYWWMWPWGNEEDGVLFGDMYKSFDSDAMQIIYWTCVRNPTNNLRFVPILSCKINPKKVGSVGSNKNVNLYDLSEPEWFFAWCGVYSNFWVQFKMFGSLWRFWIGWKIMPKDINGVSAYRKPGAGFALQFKKVK